MGKDLSTRSATAYPAPRGQPPPASSPSSDYHEVRTREFHQGHTAAALCGWVEGKHPDAFLII